MPHGIVRHGFNWCCVVKQHHTIQPMPLEDFQARGHPLGAELAAHDQCMHNAAIQYVLLSQWHVYTTCTPSCSTGV